MTYYFICPECNNEQEIDMPMKDYKGDGHICEKCGAELIRNPDSYPHEYIAKCDGFFGKG